MRAGIIVALSVFIIGCDNGVNCPIDPPSCCYNALFGCGTFDLPQGCSCSQYGLFRSYPAANYPRRSAISGSLSGAWQGQLDLVTSTCQGAPPLISGALNISERSGRITVTVPFYGTLRGARTRSGFRVTGEYAPLLSSCKISVRASYASRSKRSGRLVTAVENRCPFTATACSVAYQGTLSH